MAKFDKAQSSKSFSVVSRKAAEKAQVITIQNIANENLIDNPENGEDISFTDDLELSIKENGFTDPLEVTDFGQVEGKYMILSGHRRRCAGVKTGINFFPCLVRHFDNEISVKNYLLSSNAQRDSARDPFLFSKRYKMHEQYLIDSGFSGNIREEVAKRLGLSVQQADRYNAMNRIILDVWDMIREERVSMSSVQPLATHREDEQKEIYIIMQEALNEGAVLTRGNMKILIDGYREGKKTWADIVNESISREDSLSGSLLKMKNMGEEPVEELKKLEDSNEDKELKKVRNEKSLQNKAKDEEKQSSISDKNKIYKVTDTIELSFNYRNSNLLVIYGKHVNGGFIAIPNWKICVEAGDMKNVDYNTEKLKEVTMDEAAKVIAENLSNYAESNLII